MPNANICTDWISSLVKSLKSHITMKATAITEIETHIGVNDFSKRGFTSISEGSDLALEMIRLKVMARLRIIANDNTIISTHSNIET